MPTLVLASNPRQVLPAIFEAVPELHGARKAVYIWTASKAAPGGAPAWVEENAAYFRSSFGWDVMPLDLDGITPAALADALAGRDVIYMEGGNTFFLLKTIKESGFDRLIAAKLAEPGVVYIGCSAGSIVAGPDISIAGWKGLDPNDCGQTDLTGFGLVEYNIFPHYLPHYEQELRAIRDDPSQPRLELLTDDEFMLEHNGVSRRVSVPAQS